jgi:hypothetical protein
MQMLVHMHAIILKWAGNRQQGTNLDRYSGETAVRFSNFKAIAQQLYAITNNA